MRGLLGRLLRATADLLDGDHRPRPFWLSFTHGDGVGVVFHDDGTGCPLWYLTDEYEQAWQATHEEAT